VPAVAHYRFLTTWLLDAPREAVFQALWDSESWPSWWHGVESVRTVEPGDAEGVGSLGRYVWKSRLPYRLEFDSRIVTVDRPRYMEGEVTGELEGRGRFRLFEENGLTSVLYEWDVATTAPWMNRLAPALRPVFAWNHDVVMRWGGEGLGRLLGARLLARG
jgi:uncharacterized protein YndB with AHSA1/START domain